MSQVVALIPARSGSKSCPGKNLRKLGGKTLIEHAYDCAVAAGLDGAVITTDYDAMPWSKPQDEVDEDVRQRTGGVFNLWMPLKRPAALAQDDTPMFDVVKHAVDTLGLDDSDVICLLQPTAPLRTPDHIRQAIALLRESGADSVVSVVDVGMAEEILYIGKTTTMKPPYGQEVERLFHLDDETHWATMPTRRQGSWRAYRRDGTVYAFPVSTLRSGTIYGYDARPLIIPPEQSCELDTEADWQALEKRWAVNPVTP
jgi:CMP-N,N'-diacetyllegionaminic acid synthase